MGVAEQWQDKVASNFDKMGYDVYNPRRPDWDSSWKQSKDNPEFVKQVNWELDHIELANSIFMYFDKNTKSPITLLEFGFIAARYPFKLIVCCPDGFWRKGNVDVVCSRYGIKQIESLEELC